VAPPWDLNLRPADPYTTRLTASARTRTKASDHLCLSDSSVVLCGDFNLPHINWVCLNSDSDSISSHFIECVQENACSTC